MQALSGQAVQYEDPTEKLPEGRPRLEDVKWGYEDGRQVLVQFGIPFSDSRCCSWGSISPRMAIGKNWTGDVECRNSNFITVKNHALFPRLTVFCLRMIFGREDFNETFLYKFVYINFFHTVGQGWNLHRCTSRYLKEIHIISFIQFLILNISIYK